MKGKVNVDQDEPTGAFVGAEASRSIAGEPLRKSKGPQRVSGSNFMAEGESQATSVKAARIPTHWRRGGFVQRKADGGEVRSESTDYAKSFNKADRGTSGKWEDQKKNLEDFARTRRETGYKSGGWMKGAVKHPGALHRSLGVPQGQKIPAAKIEKAAHSSNPTLRKRAVLAETFAKHRPK